MAGYVQIGDIKGEATDKNHEGWINLVSVGHTLNRPVTPGASGNTTKRSAVEWGLVLLEKELDASSPKLQESIAKGTVFPTVKIDLCTAVGDDSRTPYCQWELSNVLVSSYSINGVTSGADVPTEQLSLAYEKIKVVYDQRDEKGASKGKVEYAWNIGPGTK